MENLSFALLFYKYLSQIHAFILIAKEEKDADPLQKLQRHFILYINSSNLVLFLGFAIPAKANTDCFDFF